MNLFDRRPSFALVVMAEAFLAALFLLGVGAIALLPSVSAEAALSLPEYADLRNPLLAIAIAFVLLGLIALATIALLVQRIYSGSMLSRSSLLWVDVLVVTVVCAVALIISGSFVISNGQAGSPFLLALQVTGCLMLLAIASITLVLRSLLSNSIDMRTELDEVV